MTTLSALKMVIVTANSFRETGAYHPALPTTAANWVERLEEAQAADCYDLTDTITHAAEARDATEFEAQQDALASLVATADQALDFIAEDKMPRIERPLRKINELVGELRQAMVEVRDHYRYDRAALDKSRRLAATLCAATSHGNADNDTVISTINEAAQRAFDSVERADTMDFNQRQHHADEAVRQIDRIAA